MPITLSDLKTNLQTKIGRGTSADTQLVGLINKAIRRVERLRNWPFMYHINTVITDPSAEFPRTLYIPNRTLRSIDYAKIIEQDDEVLETYKPLNNQKDLKVWDPPSGALPTEYCLFKERRILLDDHPEDSTLKIEWGWWEYSDIGDVAGATHWLFDNAQELVEDLAQAYHAKQTRDFQRAATLLALCQPEVDALVGAAEDQELEDSELVMRRDFYSELGG